MHQSKATRNSNPIDLKSEIDPIYLIEAWSLCHHLGCVVEYIAKAGHKDSYFEDLRKAEWYLTREIERRRARFNSCHLNLLTTQELTPRHVSEGWNLPVNLSQILENIRSSIDNKDSVEFLLRAVSCLQAELSKQQE